MTTVVPLSDRFRLVCLSKEELKVQTKVDDYDMWGAPALSHAQYQHKEALQRATAFSRRGSVFWALVERTNADDSTSDAELEAGRDPICVHCESHRFDCIFRKASGELVRGHSHHIGSVFTLPAYRKQGLATFFMKEIVTHMAQLPNAVASVLYSDIGADYYDRLGWRVYASTSAELDALTPRNVAATGTKGDGDVATPSAGTKLHLDDELDALLARDNRRLEAEIQSSAYAGRAVFAPLPTRDSVEWQFCIGAYYASIRGFTPLPTQTGLWLADDAFVVWCHNHKGATLNVVRARFPADGQHDVVLTLLRAALAEAQAFRLPRVMIWDPPAPLFAPEVVAAVDIVQRERTDSLSSAMVFAQLHEAGGHAALPLWVANEKFAWV